MTEMVKRAGEAVIAALKRPFGDFSPAEMKEPWNVAAGRMVILAALDPEDEARVRYYAKRLREVGPVDMSDRDSQRVVRFVLDLLRKDVA